jgi:hypothetical protein
MNANPTRPATRKRQGVKEDPKQHGARQRRPSLLVQKRIRNRIRQMVFKQLSREYGVFYTLNTERINSPS